MKLKLLTCLWPIWSYTIVVNIIQHEIFTISLLPCQDISGNSKGLTELICSRLPSSGAGSSTGTSGYPLLISINKTLIFSIFVPSNNGFGDISVSISSREMSLGMFSARGTIEAVPLIKLSFISMRVLIIIISEQHEKGWIADLAKFAGVHQFTTSGFCNLSQTPKSDMLSHP